MIDKVRKDGPDDRYRKEVASDLGMPHSSSWEDISGRIAFEDTSREKEKNPKKKEGE